MGPHPEGTSKNPDIFDNIQKIQIAVYNGGLRENIFGSKNK